MVKKLKHDRYLDCLCDQIKDDYDSIQTNIELFSSSKAKKQRKVAEIDILAKKNNAYYVYEVKCSYRKTKARKQLLRIKRLLPDINIKRLFFFCGESGTLEAIL